MFSHTKDCNNGSKILFILISIILHNRLINIKQVHPLAELSSCRHFLHVYCACSVPFSHIYFLPSHSPHPPKRLSCSCPSLLGLCLFIFWILAHFYPFLSHCIHSFNKYLLGKQYVPIHRDYTHTHTHLHSRVYRLVERHTSWQWCVLAVTHVCVNAVVGEQRGNPNLTLTSFQEMQFPAFYQLPKYIICTHINLHI